MTYNIVPEGSLNRANIPNEYQLNLEKVVDLKVESKEDADIIKYLTSTISPYSEFQSRAFVVNGEGTDHRKVQQCAMEIRSRVVGLAESTYRIRKAEITKKKLERAMSEEDDDLEKELLQIEIDKTNFDIENTRLLQEQSQYEIKVFIDIVKSVAPDNTMEKLLTFKDNWEEKEEEYWVKRFGKQAMMDILMTGKIQSGNLDSIIGMPQDSQKKVIGYALMQAQQVEKGITQIGEAVRNVLLSTEKLEKPFDLPDITGIEGKLGGTPSDIKKNLQIGRQGIDEQVTGNALPPGLE